MKFFLNVLMVLTFSSVSFTTAIAQDRNSIGFKPIDARALSSSQFFELHEPRMLGDAQFNVVRVLSPSEAQLGIVQENGIFFKTMEARSVVLKNGKMALDLDAGPQLTLDPVKMSLSGLGDEVQVAQMNVFESPMQLRPAITGLSKTPEVYLLQNNIAFHGKNFNSLRLVKELDKSYSLYFGKALPTKTDHLLNELDAMVIKNIKFTSTNKRSLIADGVVLELLDDHIMINKVRVDALPYRSFRNDNGHYLTSGFKKMDPQTLQSLKAAGFKQVHFAKSAIVALSLISNVMSFLPSNNPFAVVKGLKCEGLAEGTKRIACRKENLLNPFNNVVECTEILYSWELNREEDLCAAKLRGYSFRVENRKGYNFLKTHGFMNKRGSNYFQNLKLKQRKEVLRKEMGTEIIETTEEVVPQGEDLT